MARWRLNRVKFGSEEISLSDGDVASVGRSPDNKVSISSLVISRNHCVFKAEKDKLTVTDLQSSNGVYVGLIKIPPRVPYTLKDRDILGIGWTEGAPVTDIKNEEKYMFKVNKIDTMPNRIKFEIDDPDEIKKEVEIENNEPPIPKNVNIKAASPSKKIQSSDVSGISNSLNSKEYGSPNKENINITSNSTLNNVEPQPSCSKLIRLKRKLDEQFKITEEPPEKRIVITINNEIIDIYDSDSDEVNGNQKNDVAVFSKEKPRPEVSTNKKKYVAMLPIEDSRPDEVVNILEQVANKPNEKNLNDQIEEAKQPAIKEEVKMENDLEYYNVKQEYMGYDEEPIEINSDSDSESEQWFMRLSQSSPGKPFLKVKRESKAKPDENSYSQMDDFIVDLEDDEEYEQDIISIPTHPPPENVVTEANKLVDVVNKQSIICAVTTPEKTKDGNVDSDEDFLDDIISLKEPIQSNAAQRFQNFMDIDIRKEIRESEGKDVVDNSVKDDLPAVTLKSSLSLKSEDSKSSLSLKSTYSRTKPRAEVSEKPKSTQMIEPSKASSEKQSNTVVESKHKSSSSSRRKHKHSSSKRHISDSQKEERKKKLKEIATKGKEQSATTSKNKSKANVPANVTAKVTSTNRGAFLTDVVQVVKPMKRTAHGATKDKEKSDNISTDNEKSAAPATKIEPSASKRRHSKDTKLDNNAIKVDTTLVTVNKADTKLRTVDSKSEKGESKSGKKEIKSEKSDSKMGKADSKSGKVDSKSGKGESKSGKVDSKSGKVDIKSERVDSTSAKADRKLEKKYSKSHNKLGKITRNSSKGESSKGDNKLDKGESSKRDDKSEGDSKSDKDKTKSKSKHVSKRKSTDSTSDSKHTSTNTRIPLKNLKPLSDSKTDTFSGKPFSKVEPFPPKKAKKSVRFSEDPPKVVVFEIEEGNRMKKTSLAKSTLVDVRQRSSISLEKITLGTVLRWNPQWLAEQMTFTEPPPILGHDEPMAVLHFFNSHKQYVGILGNLLLMEIWEDLTQGHGRARNKPGLPMRIAHFPPPPAPDRLVFELFTISVNVSVPNTENKTIPRPGDLLSVAFGPDNAKTQRFFYVLNVRMLPAPPNNVNSFYCISLQCCYTDKMRNLKQGELMMGVNLSRIQTTLSMFEALENLAGSPLLEIILRPEPKHFQRNEFNSATWKSNYPPPDTLNPNQLRAVAESVTAALGDRPCINMVQGPPGTGKSSVISAIVLSYFNDVNLKRYRNRGKILICASSNAAVDEITDRLLKKRQQLPQPERFKLVRVGRLESMHQRIVNVSSQSLAKRDADLRLKTGLAKPALDEEMSHLDAKINMWKSQALDAKDPVRVAYCQQKVTQLISRVALLKNGGGGKTDEIRSDQLLEIENRIIEGADIIVTTLGSANSTKLRGLKGRIALCIIDEAGQAIEPGTLVPLTLNVTKLTLVGDPQQLSGYIMSQRAKKYGLGESLFSRITSCMENWPKGSPNPVILLNQQYRMHSEIADYPNRAFYDGQIRNAISRPRPSLGIPPYLLLSISSGDNGQGACGGNDMEAWGVARLVASLQGVAKRAGDLSLGVITPYHGQKEFIKKKLRFFQEPGAEAVDVNTADSFQGQERDLVVVSLARSQGVGFLTDSGRMNVMLTRARHALIVCLNPHAMQVNLQWRTLVEDAQRRNLYRVLPHNMCMGPGGGERDDILQYVAYQRRN